MRFWREPLDQDRHKVPYGIVHIIEERCKGCGFCVEFCPQEVLVMSKSTNARGYHPPAHKSATHCINCGLCTLLCPDFAIYVEDGGVQPPDQMNGTDHSGGKG